PTVDLVAVRLRARSREGRDRRGGGRLARSGRRARSGGSACRGHSAGGPGCRPAGGGEGRAGGSPRRCRAPAAARLALVWTSIEPAVQHLRAPPALPGTTGDAGRPYLTRVTRAAMP